MATPNVVPRADQEGGLGTAAKSWGKLFIENPTAGGTAAATISNLDVDQIALDIDANNTTANIIDLSTSTLTTGSALFMDVNNSATTAAIGNIINIDFDKSGVISSGLATMSAINVNMNDAATNGVSGSATMTGANITLTNSNSQGTISQNGLIISCTGADAVNTKGIIVITEDGAVDFSIRSSADPGDKFTIATTAAGATTIATIDDDNHAADLTFRVDGFVKFDSDGTDGGGVEIENGSASGNAALLIDNDDLDQIALDIDAENTTAPVIDVLANDLTTAAISNFNITNSTTSNYSNLAGVFGDWDYSKSGDAGDGVTHRYVGLQMKLNDGSSSNHANSTVIQTGMQIEVDSANTNGTNTNTALELSVTDATINYGIGIGAEDGAGADIIMKSSANFSDYATIAVGAEGATTITTVDADTTAAHLTLDIDGDFKIDNAGGDTFFYTNGNTDDFLQLTIGANGEATFTTVDANAAVANIEFAADGNIVLDAAGTITFEQGANSASMPASDGKVVVQTTTMKVMPQEFIANGDSGRPALAADQQTNKMGIHQYAATDELYAHIEIPYGHTVTHVQVHMSSNVSSAVTILSYNYQTGATDAVTSTTADGNENKALSSNTIAGGATQDLLLKVDMGADNIYLWGATVTLAVT